MSLVLREAHYDSESKQLTVFEVLEIEHSQGPLPKDSISNKDSCGEETLPSRCAEDISMLGFL